MSEKNDTAVSLIKESRDQSSPLSSESSRKPRKRVTIDDRPYVSDQTRRLEARTPSLRSTDADTISQGSEEYSKETGDSVKKLDNQTQEAISHEEQNSSNLARKTTFPVSMLRQISRKVEKPSVVVRSKSFLDSSSQSMQETIEYELFQNFLEYLNKPEDMEDGETTKAQDRQTGDELQNMNEVGKENVASEPLVSADKLDNEEQDSTSITVEKTSSTVADVNAEGEGETDSQKKHMANKRQFPVSNQQVEEQDQGEEIQEGSPINEKIDGEFENEELVVEESMKFPQYDPDTGSDSSDSDDDDNEQNGEAEQETEAKTKDSDSLAQEGSTSSRLGSTDQADGESSTNKKGAEDMNSTEQEHRTDDGDQLCRACSTVGESEDDSGDEEYSSEDETESSAGSTHEICANRNGESSKEAKKPEKVMTKDKQKFEKGVREVQKKIHYSLIDTPYMNVPLKNIYSLKVRKELERQSKRNSSNRLTESSYCHMCGNMTQDTNHAFRANLRYAQLSKKKKKRTRRPKFYTVKEL